MCWNEQVSLNTFLFSSFVLLLVAYNNTYTQYKTDFFNSIWKYIFFISFISMQLIEFFIWRNINNTFYNHIFSTAAALLIFIQPIISLMLLPDISLRNNLLVTYLVFFIPYFTYKFITNNMKSQISIKGHLEWLFFDTNILLFSGWLFFFLFSLFYTRSIEVVICGIVLFCISFYNYYNDKTIGSMWCWIVNSSMIGYAFYLLLYLPFYERSLC
jgi:hypothetical protein